MESGMYQKGGGRCEIKPLEKMRFVVLEATKESKRWNHVHLPMQIDISSSRERISAMKADGCEAPSMTGFIIYCFAKAIDQNKSLQAIRKGRNLHIFDEVDVSTVIERENQSGEPIPTSVIIRRANEKKLKEIHDEIRTAQVAKLEGSVLGDGKRAKLTNIFLKLPGFVRKLVWWWCRQSPRFRKNNMGTVLVTSFGMFAEGFDAVWAIPNAPYPLILTIGPISKHLKYFEDGNLGEHELINLTLTVDHDVVDGGPATRFLVQFKQLLVDGYGLDRFNS